MATIKDAKTLVKENYFTNLSADEGMNMTMMLSGPHGIGKTKIIQSAAKDLGERTVYDEFCGGPSKNVESFLPILKKYYEFDFVYSSSVSWYERDYSSRIVKDYS